MVEVIPLKGLSASILDSLPSLPSDLFPLPLSAFEKYLIWDETPEQPMNSFIELHFLQPLQVGAMEEAIRAACKIHPTLVCTIGERAGHLFWVHRPDFRHQLTRQTLASPLKDGRPVAIDLWKEPGIRFWYREDAQGHSRVLIQLHHAATDGVGLRRFLIDAMTLYAYQTASESVDPNLRPPWSKIDPGLLKRRFDFSDTFSSLPSQPLSTWQRLKNAHYFHFKLPQTLAAPDAKSLAGQPVDSEEPLEHLVLDRELSEAILERARVGEIGINELSLALLFETCSLWNQEHGDRDPQSRIRVLLPYDLRSRIDLRMPAANRLSFSFLGRTRSECNDTEKLIRSIGAEVDSFRQSHLPLDFLSALDGVANHPKVMRWAIGRHRNMATSVLTYAGDVSRGMQKYFPEQDGARIVGDVKLDKILAAPPVRQNTHWSLGLCINWGQLCISAAWNRDALSRQQCIELLKLYESRWLTWLGK